MIDHKFFEFDENGNISTISSKSINLEDSEQLIKFIPPHGKGYYLSLIEQGVSPAIALQKILEEICGL